MDINKIPTLEDFENIDKYILEDEVLPISEICINKIKTCDKYPTGFYVFDKAMEGGFKDGDLVIISGISGEGKTSLSQTLTYNLTKQGIPCLWFSYEVGLEYLHQKFIKMGIDEHYYAYAPKKNTTGKLEWLKYKIKEASIKYMTKVIFIDHLDFLTPSDVKTGDNEAIFLKKIAMELKTFAIKLGVVIIAMGHLKKLPNNQEPSMQDIGYSAGIFQNADYVFIIMREKQKQNQSKYEEKIQGDLYTNNSFIKIVKNRQTGQNKFIKCEYLNDKFIPI